MRYRPEIDGLRAFAVVPVLLFHGSVTGFTGGYIGVDVFFVISGYLIALILLDDLENERFSILGFYERRARRILPALIFVVLLTSGFAWFWMLPSELAEYGKSLAAVAVFASNIFFWQETGYFRPSSELNPLLHTWSLAVEEQYYLFFPVFLFLVWRYCRRGLTVVVATLIVASLALAHWASQAAPVAGFYLAPTRIWELLAGALAAVVLRKLAVPKSHFAGAFGLLLICASVVLFSEDTPTPSLWTSIPVGGAVLVVLFAEQGTLAARILAWKPFVWVGLISYSVYLFHQPILALARLRMSPELEVFTLLLLYLATFILSWFCWRFVELPFRRRRDENTENTKVLGVSLATLVVLLVSGVILNASGGAPERTKFTNIASLEQDQKPHHGLGDFCTKVGFTTSERCRTAELTKAVVWGDSFAVSLVPALMSSASQVNFVQHTLLSCGPFPGMANHSPSFPWKPCITFNDRVLEWISKDNTIEIVVMSSDFSELNGPIFLRDGTRVTDLGEIRQHLEKSVIDTVLRLRAHGKNVVIVGPPPRNGKDLGRCYLHQYVYGGNFELCDFAPSRVSDLDRRTAAFLSDLEESVPIIDMKPYFCTGNSCSTAINGVNLYRDAGHLTAKGAELLGIQFDLYGKIISASKNYSGLSNDHPR